MQKGRIALALLLCLTLVGCADARQAREAVPEEKRLVVYTSHKADVYPAIIEEFERRTGIWVQVETGGTNELLARIAREDGTACADLMFGGGVESLQAYQDYFLPYDGEALARVDASYRPSGNFAPFSTLPLVLIYQPRLVEAPPTGWADLLSPRWRGQIAFADPAVSGSSYTALATMLQCLPGEKEALIAAFVDNLDGRMLSGSGEVVGAVAAGRYLLGVTLEETARKAIAAGADVAMAYPEEGTSAVPDGIAQMKGAEHLAVEHRTSNDNHTTLHMRVDGVPVDLLAVPVFLHLLAKQDLHGIGLMGRGHHQQVVVDVDLRLCQRHDHAVAAPDA